MKRFPRWFLLCWMAFSSASAFASGIRPIEIDGHGPGRVFEGIGALSAGASSRLLIDYPGPQRGEILDLLFKPNFGAAFHHLKVEVGGDVNSTDGTEPSHARTREEFDNPRPEYFRRGYEWWLMREAKRRDPRIALDVLQWGAPAWIGEKDHPWPDDPDALEWPQRKSLNARKFYTRDNAEFVAAFIRGAKKYHDLDIDFCGIWNETPHDLEWIKLLRRTLDGGGLERVKIVASDQTDDWNIVEAMERDPALKAAVHAVGVHYPKYRSSDAARRCGKPLSASEDGPLRPLNDWSAAGALAKIYNRNYVLGRMTRTVIWSLATAYYDALPWPDSGPIKADSPWSGHYEVHPALWAVAHTTQFVRPGWQYLDCACGMLRYQGSYVSLRSPAPDDDYSIVAETVDARRPQTLVFRVGGGLSAKPLHVWRSDRRSQFERLDDLPVLDGLLTVTFEPGCIYSLTTTTGQQKGRTNPPPSADFPFPYTDDFDDGRVGGLPNYFSDQGGVFEIADRPDGGRCLRQSLARQGIDWHSHPNPEPYTMIGSKDWRDYGVSCQAFVEDSGYAAVYGRIAEGLQSEQPPRGYWLKANADGRWELKASTKTLASGRAPFPADRWHTLELRFDGPRITALIDGEQMASIEDRAYSGGMAGLGSGWNRARFDDFAVRAL
ncbi:MAG: hypothetical protein JW959_08145 [Pirellulales bacterium]|nr:hypothetical protein [Pirellulales bacterium]